VLRIQLNPGSRGLTIFINESQIRGEISMRRYLFAGAFVLSIAVLSWILVVRLDMPSTGGAQLTADCSLPESSIRKLFASEDELKKQIAGQWLSCDDKGWWGIEGNKKPIGAEFTLDGHWFALFRDDSGAIVRGRGFDYEGTVQIIDTSQMNEPGHYQVNVNYAGGGMMPVQPVFSDTPRKMRLNSGAGTITYVPAPAR
jgi:hypothetical protein